MLHLLAASEDPIAGEFLALLLTHPSVNCNLADGESGWTALHRALYAGNLDVALALLSRADVDTHVRDAEGLTPFELYNATVDGTAPSAADWAHGADMLVWGGNRNYNLGLGHCNDSALPERVRLRRPVPPDAAAAAPGVRFDRPRVRDAAMSRWHTVVVTTEPRSNVYVCGVGAQGRMGRAPAAQPSLEPLRDLPEPVRAAVVGADHTLLVTQSGAVYTFGSNRFAQLGYVVEEGMGTVSSSGGVGAAPDVQVTPRRVLGALKRDVVLGAAASRLHSAVYTADALYTWGTNNGQLGYDRHSAPVQTQPRRATAVSVPIRQVAASEFATACLLETWDVVVLHGDAHFRVSFPVPRMPSDASLFRPRHAQPKPMITKLSCGGTTFAALTDLGDLYTFALEHASTTGARVVPPRPQLVWGVRRKFSAVRDVAVGLDGALILCTADGHVYVRERRLDVKSKARAPRFQAVPFVQRVVRVLANDVGSFAAMHVPASLPALPARAQPIEEELAALVPPLSAPVDAPAVVVDESDDEHASDSLQRSAARAGVLVRQVAAWRGWPPRPADGADAPAPTCCGASRGCDVVLLADGGAVPVHRVMLAERAPHLLSQAAPVPAAARALLAVDGSGTLPPGAAAVRVPMALDAALFLVHYLYTDELPPVWTASLGVVTAPLCARLGVRLDDVRASLTTVAAADDAHLGALHDVLRSGLARAPEPTLRRDLAALYAGVARGDAPGTDVVLHLADRDVACHGLFLRRSPVLQALFEWRRTRGDRGAPTPIDMRHWPWRTVRVGLAHLYTDAGAAVFAGMDAEGHADQFVDLVLDVLQLADELLLDALQLVCVRLLAPRVKATNVAALLTDALHYNAPAFAAACMDYATRNLEALLERGCLAELVPEARVRLTAHIKAQQDRHLHRSVASDRLVALSVKHQDYLATLDLPKPSLHLVCLRVPKRAKSPALSATDAPPVPEPVEPLPEPADDSLLFAMDDVEQDTWHTVKSRPRRDEARTVSLAAPAAPASASGSRTDARVSSARGSPPWRALDSSPALARSPPSWRTPDGPPVSAEAQSAIAQMPVTARVSQKERKKQRAPPAAASTPTPVRPAWGGAPQRAASRTEAWGAPSPGTSPAQVGSPPALSFAQIQAQQQAAVRAAAAQQRQPKSFAQILDEEGQARERERREHDEAAAFERWFEEESRRVQSMQAQRSESRRGSSRRGRGRRGRPHPLQARIDESM